MILVRKYHPVNNKPELGDICALAMAKLNSAYHGFMGSLERSLGINESIDSGNLLTLLDDLHISAVLNDSYTLYSQPALMEEWIKVLSTTLQSRPVDLSSRKGVQFDIEHLSVSLYNNGTINCHGRMGVYFGSTKLEELCKTHMQSFSAKVECPTKNRSRKFTQYRRMFSDGTDTNKSPKKANSLGGDCEGHLNLSADTNQFLALMNEQTEPASEKSCQTEKCPTCVVSREEIQELRTMLTSALRRVDALENQVKQHAQLQTCKSEELDEKIHSLSTEHKSMKATFGSQIAGVIDRVKANSNGPAARDNHLPPNPWKIRPNVGAHSESDRKEKQDSSSNKVNPRPEVSFQPKKCVVIHDFKHRVTKDMELRKLIGKTSQDVVIERIIRTGERAPKYILQLTKEDMVDKVLTHWDEGNLGSSKIRRVENVQKRNLYVGFAKHIPVDITDEQLTQVIGNKYHGSKAERLLKNGKPIETVKVLFSDGTQLRDASDNGLWLELLEYSIRVPVSPENPRVIYTQCFNCWRFGHIGKHCESQTTCKCCAGNHEHEECPNDFEKCRNCGGDHCADKWNVCEAFGKYREKRIKNFNKRHGQN